MCSKLKLFSPQRKTQKPPCSVQMCSVGNSQVYSWACVLLSRLQRILESRGVVFFLQICTKVARHSWVAILEAFRIPSCIMLNNTDISQWQRDYSVNRWNKYNRLFLMLADCFHGFFCFLTHLLLQWAVFHCSLFFLVANWRNLK